MCPKTLEGQSLLPTLQLFSQELGVEERGPSGSHPCLLPSHSRGRYRGIRAQILPHLCLAWNPDLQASLALLQVAYNVPPGGTAEAAQPIELALLSGVL